MPLFAPNTRRPKELDERADSHAQPEKKLVRDVSQLLAPGQSRLSASENLRCGRWHCLRSITDLAVFIGKLVIPLSGYQMNGFDWRGNRKRRTREHIIEEMSFNFLERKVLERGHMLVRGPQREYGWDATMFHFAPPNGAPPNGEIENGEIRIQLKATDNLDLERECAACRVQTKDLHFWYWEDQQTIDLQIPWSNHVTLRTIDRFRELSLARINREQ